MDLKWWHVSTQCSEGKPQLLRWNQTLSCSRMHSYICLGGHWNALSAGATLRSILGHHCSYGKNFTSTCSSWKPYRESYSIKAENAYRSLSPGCVRQLSSSVLPSTSRAEHVQYCCAYGPRNYTSCVRPTRYVPGRLQQSLSCSRHPDALEADVITSRSVTRRDDPSCAWRVACIISGILTTRSCQPFLVL